MTPQYAKYDAMVRAARTTLLADHPFWGDLVFGLPITWNETLSPPTAATNGKKIWLHPEFFETIIHGERVFVLAHEALHGALLHCVRCGPRDEAKWGAACDIVVNQLLVQNNVGTMPKFCIYEPDLYQRGGGMVEKIYELLDDGAESPDKVMKAPEGEEEAMAADWRNKLQEAVQNAKDQGRCSGDLEEFVKALTTPEVPWEQHLRNFVMTCKGSDRSWSKINRRHASSGIKLPGTYGERMGPMVVGLDNSGSVNNQLVAKFGAELGSIQEELRPEMIHVLYFDDIVQKHEEYGPDDPFTLKAYGRGGTAFSPIFKYIDDNGLDPSCAVIMTDLYCDDYGPPPEYPVLWCAMETDVTKTPWGQVIKVE